MIPSIPTTTANNHPGSIPSQASATPRSLALSFAILEQQKILAAATSNFQTLQSQLSAFIASKKNQQRRSQTASALNASLAGGLNSATASAQNSPRATPRNPNSAAQLLDSKMTSIQHNQATKRMIENNAEASDKMQELRAQVLKLQSENTQLRSSQTDAAATASVYGLIDL